MSKAIQNNVKADVKAIKSLGSGIGNKNVINNSVRDNAIKDVTSLGKKVENAMSSTVDASIRIRKECRTLYFRNNR